MLPVLDREGGFTARQTVLHSLALLIVSLAAGRRGHGRARWYLGGAFVLGVALTLFALRLVSRPRPGRGAGPLPGLGPLPAGAVLAAPARPGSRPCAMTADLPTAQRRPERHERGVLLLLGWIADPPRPPRGAPPGHAGGAHLLGPLPGRPTWSTTSRWARCASPARAPIRTVYFAVLISHTILAVAIVPLVLLTVTRALARALRRPPGDRPGDAAPVGLGVGVGGGRLLDALPALTPAARWRRCARSMRTAGLIATSWGIRPTRRSASASPGSRQRGVGSTSAAALNQGHGSGAPARAATRGG